MHNPIQIRSISWEWANSYFFSYEGKNNVIDVWFLDFRELYEALWEQWKVDNLFITHGHFDHIASIEKIIDAFPDIICHIHENERVYLGKSEYNLSEHFNEDFSLNEKYFENIRTFKDSEMIDWIKAIHTPGHTIWSSCFYIAEWDVCFSWDTMFSDTYWRVDLKTWSMEQMKSSIKKLYALSPVTMIYPGHMESEILGKIKIYL